MRPDRESLALHARLTSPTVSSRLFSEVWKALGSEGLSPLELLGDLPIAVDERGVASAPVQWEHFQILLRRAERELGGPEGLERCGERLGRGHRPRGFRAALAFATSPASLYRAAAVWALPRGVPGAESELRGVSRRDLVIDVRLPDAIGPSSPLFHLGTGVFRMLPGLLGMPPAVVRSHVGDFHARYELTLPASRTLRARLRRFVRSVLLPTSVLRELEDRQLELDARYAALVRSHQEIAEHERRLRAATDAAVDVLCELDENGRIVFVNAAIRALTGYSPDQVTGSHYRLWIPTDRHAEVTESFLAFRAAPLGTTVGDRTFELHAAHGRRILVEASIRSHVNPDGEWRAVACLRDMSHRETTALERLRARLGARGQRGERHPLERSLARLIALLEGLEQSEKPALADQSFQATRRMARVVEQVLLHDQEGQSSAAWLDAHKLVARLVESPARRAAAKGLVVAVNESGMPAEIHGPERLLEACFDALLDWGVTASRAADPSARVLSISLEHTPALAPDAEQIRFEVALEPFGPSERSGAPASASEPGASAALSEADLVLALAADTAQILGGALEEPQGPGGPQRRAIRLPQPPTPRNRTADQSGTRSMSAPSARSFSSIRS